MNCLTTKDTFLCDLISDKQLMMVMIMNIYQTLIYLFFFYNFVEVTKPYFKKNKRHCPKNCTEDIHNSEPNLLQDGFRYETFSQ